MYENSTGKLVLDNSSQTVYSKFELSEKVETMTLKNEEFFKRPSQSNIALGYFITFSTSLHTAGAPEI